MTEKITWAMLISEIHNIPELEKLFATSLHSALLKSNIGPEKAISMQGLSELIFQDRQPAPISPLSRFFVNAMAIVNAYGFHESGQTPEEDDKYLDSSLTTMLLERLRQVLLGHN